MPLRRQLAIAFIFSSIAISKAALPSPADVLNQNGAGFPQTWGTNAGKPVPAYYEMAKSIAQDAATKDELVKGLRALPSLSVTVALDDLFGAEKGIYANPRQSGSDWERAALVEYFPTNGRPGFHVQCGIRIQGGWNRRPEESPKHAFRLLFRKKYGPGKLKYPLFGGGEPRAFDELILRAGCNNTWLHWSGEERRRGDYIRDQWMRDSYRAMGQPSARGEFVHLYLNGLYWGVYNLTERPDANFAAAHFGGRPDDYDARNGENILEGDTRAWERLFALANSGVNAERYSEIATLLDLPAFADYMLLNLYGGNADWDRASNWYAARKRPNGKFYFFIWDGERTLEDVNANTAAFDDDLSPPRLFQKLRQNAEFKKLFRERAQKHLTGRGALTSNAAAERFEQWSKPLAAAILAESARWGAYRHDVHQYKTGPYEVYTRDKHWAPEIKRILTEYFPQRTPVVLKQCEEITIPASDK
jgi:hypothetical protein